MKIFQVSVFIILGQIFGWYLNYTFFGKIVYGPGLTTALVAMPVLSLVGWFYYRDFLKD